MCGQSFAQTGNKEALNASRSGYEFEQSNKFSEALFEYNKAIAADPKYPYPLERIAAMYQHLHNYPRAIEFFHRAVKLDSNFDDYNLYNLATCYKALQKNDSAVLFYRKFLQHIKPVVAEDSAAVRDANTLVTFTEQCITLRAKPKNTDDPLLVKELSSRYDDFSPAITPDGKTLYFTSRRPSTNSKAYEETKDFGDDIFYSTKQTAGWTPPVALPPPINSKDNEGAVSVSADGQTVYYSLCRRPDGFGDCDIYFSEMHGTTWSAPKNLGPSLNSPQWDSQPSISPNGLEMYFSSRRAGSIDGSEDIWVSYKETNGMWGTPINLGAPINTGGSERSPFMANDGVTLYFSSNGHPGFGGHDLFMTRKKDDGTWTQPVNLGSPINSSGDDEFLTLPAKGVKAFYSSQRDNLKGSMDIYEAILPPDMRPLPVTLITGIVFDKTTKKPIGAKLEVTDLAKDQILAEYNSNSETGEFQITLAHPGKQYGITASATHYAFFSHNYTMPDSAQYKEVRYEIGLTRIDTEMYASNPKLGNENNNNNNKNNNKENSGNRNTNNNGNINNGGNDTTVIPLNNIFFDFNKATLRTESITELRHMMKFLHDYPKFKIEISGHTDSIGTAEVNRKLSQERAEAVREYLVSHGIHATHVTARGYGATKPIAPNGTEEGRQKNRRTEFRIISRN